LIFSSTFKLININYESVVFALAMAASLLMIITVFPYDAYTQTISPLDSGLSIAVNDHVAAFHASRIEYSSSTIPYLLSNITCLEICSKLQDFESLDNTSALPATYETQTNVQKYFSAIFRTNPDIQKDLLSLYMPFLDSEDIALSHPNEDNLEHTLQLPGEHGVQYFSLAEIRSKAPVLKHRGVEIVSYDLESEGSPKSDMRDPVASVKLASNVVHKNGMKFMITPSRALTSLYAAQFAEYVDIYSIQAQSLQSQPSDYKKFVEETITKLQSTNPEISITAQVSTDRGSLQSMKNSILSVEKVIDGVTSWYSGDRIALDKLESFVQWFVDRYKK
jgi:hypothetical protein